MAQPEAVIEVAYARPERQWVVDVRWRDGMTALEAVEASGLLRELVELRRDDLQLGVYGQRVAPGQPLRAGDRVEIYRPLRFDPRDARRKAAQEAARSGRRSRPKSLQD
jgi:putative ubiquitin-RnfH superfamily antitoxin RatB of RatAB toxin-antitoxin module